ncbi:carboxyl-terminal-processing peptidase 3, chloroplastic [Tanacetum coccineum]
MHNNKAVHRPVVLQIGTLKFQQTMVDMLPLRTAHAAYSKIKGMLSTLGDPFTRIISPKEYQSFRIGSDGNAALKKRSGRRLTETDEYVSGHGEGILMDPMAISTGTRESQVMELH